MVENPIVGPKFKPFSRHSFTLTPSVFPCNKFGDCLALWNELKENNTLNIEESDKHCLHL